MTIQISRRTLMQTTAAAGVLAATATPAKSMAKRGGTMRLGLKGANTSDTWDARTHSDQFMINMCHGCVFDCLTEVTADGSLVGELAEEWSPNSNADVWTFKLRRGVKFHNGKSFGADDVIESLKIHVAEGAKSAAKPLVAPIVAMEKLGSHEVRLTLSGPNADFPYLMSDYHIVMYPAGQIEEAIAKGIGTGPYRVVTFDPGVRLVVRRFEDHYNLDNSGWFDEIEAIAINDDAARTNALLTGQVDIINEVDKKTLPLIKANPNFTIAEVTGNKHNTFPMQAKVAPFSDINVRKALKHACKRQEMVDKILQGHGAIANDTPIGPANQYVATDIPQLDYDPDKSKFYLKKAGMSSLKVDLSVSDAAFSGAVDTALLYQNSAKAANIDINVVQEAADGYWSNVWLKKPWCACYWSGRATEDWMFNTAYETGVPWNDTKWEHARFQKLMLQGRGEVNPTRRREIYREMQMIISAEGATIIPMFGNYVDAYSNKIGNPGQFGNLWMLDNSRVSKKWWFA